jgi:hypothetical protein
MRRALFSLLFAVSSIGFLAIPAGASFMSSGQSVISLSFDYSDNSNAASVNNGPFNIIVDVLPGHIPGAIKVVAVSPDGSGAANLVCAYQEIEKSQVECAFNFTNDGVWSIHAQMTDEDRSNVLAMAVTNLRVTN